MSSDLFLAFGLLMRIKEAKLLDVSLIFYLLLEGILYFSCILFRDSLDGFAFDLKFTPFSHEE